MLWVIIGLDYGVWGSAWPQYRHDFRRTGYYRLPAQCVSVSEMYDVVHGTIDLSIIGVDANSDGAVDVIAAQKSSSNQGVAAFSGPTGSSLWTNSGDYFPSPGIASVAASDSKVFANGYYYFKVINLSSGTTVYQYDKPDGRGPSPAIADIDGDGCPEVYTSFSSQVVSIDGCASTYTTRWTYTLPAIAHAPALGDVDGDGGEEVLYPASDSRIYVFSASSGTLHSSFSAGVPSSINIWPDYTIATGDLDGDGRDEVVVPTYSSVSVYKYRFGTWVNVWSISGYTSGSPVALADYDGDGLEDVWVVHDQNIYVYKGTDGSLLGNTTGLGVDGFEGYGYPPTLVDLTGDRFPDALVPYNNYYVRLVDGASLSIVGTYGVTPYSITSEVIVLNFGPSLAFSVGDFSCHITTWGTCPLLPSGYEDPVNVSEFRDTENLLRISDQTLLVSSTRPEILEIYDRSGRLILKEEINGRKEVKLSSLPRGIYMVRFAGKMGRFIKR